ncbi:MAG: phytanoyl-CoA dioxygenase family protein [Pseudomonadales bacterium]
MIVDPPIDIDAEVEEYGLADHIAELDEVGLTVVPQETLRLADEWFDRLRDALLRVAEARTGVSFDLATGPSANFKGRPSETGQVIFSHLVHEDQAFVDVLTHPVKKALMTYLLGVGHRLSVSDGWVKWQTPDLWEEETTTGFHVDQSMVPAPWSWKLPHMANMNWTLTDYTKDDGALAYVPGSHREQRLPEPGEALPLAVPVEAPKGSLVIFPGGLWHGAYRKNTPGLRLTMLGQHSRPYLMPLQDFKGRLADEAFAASEDPDYLRSLMREDEGELMMVDPIAAPSVA